MNTENTDKGIRIIRGAILAAAVAASILAFALPGAADSRQGGGNHQNGRGDNGGYRQEQSGGHRWVEQSANGGRIYHQQPSYVTHPYTGSEHRRYYTYGGREWYQNTDTGIRIEISL